VTIATAIYDQPKGTKEGYINFPILPLYDGGRNYAGNGHGVSDWCTCRRAWLYYNNNTSPTSPGGTYAYIIGSNESCNSGHSYRVHHRFTNIVVINSKGPTIAFGESRPQTSSSSESAQSDFYIHSGNASSPSRASLGTTTYSHSGNIYGNATPPMALCYSTTDKYIYAATVASISAVEATIYRIKIDATTATAIGTMPLPNRSQEPTAQEMFMKVYNNYLFLCWQGRKTENSQTENTLHLSVVYIGGDGDNPFLTPSIIHTIYSSPNELVLRSFDISTSQTPPRLHVTFLEGGTKGAQRYSYVLNKGGDQADNSYHFNINPNIYTYKYLHTDLKNILLEFDTTKK
jgi:hypothetical protein